MTPANACDSCGNPTPPDFGAFCGIDHCVEAERQWDRWLDRHDDIGPD
jgi:hypothetical protein